MSAKYNKFDDGSLEVIFEERNMKTTIDKEFFEKWKNKDVAMWCKKKEYAEEFCRLMHERGLTWITGKNYLKNTEWDRYMWWTTYNFNNGTLSSIEFYKKEGYTILNFEDYVVHEQETRNTSKVQKHLELCNEIHKTYKSKNEKYGDSFNDTIKKYGMISALTRMSDKFSRIENNIINNINDNEKLEDNLLDLANYCLMTVMSLDRNVTGESIKGVWYNVDGQGD